MYKFLSIEKLGTHALILPKSRLTNFFIGFISYSLLMLICPAQTVTITGDIPYAKALIKPDGTLDVWTMSQIRADKDETVNPIEGSVMIKDINSRGHKLGGRSFIPNETKTYKGTLDLTNAVLPATIAILVDDNATLTITEIGRAEGVTEPKFSEPPYKVDGTALWNPKSYKEFPTPLPPGRKYQLKLSYYNNANLTEKYNGQVDVDGVSVYVCLLPVIKLELEIAKTTAQDDDYVCVSDGASTSPFVEVNVKLTGDIPSEHEIKIDKSGDGDIKIEPAIFKMKCGETKVVKVWGLNKSKAADSTNLDGYVDNKKATTENMTVFEGVILEFSGTFYSPVDGRDFLWRPHTGFTANLPGGKTHAYGQNLVKSNPPVVGESGVLYADVPAAKAGSPTVAEIQAFKNAVIAEDGGDISNKICFQDADQGVTRRAWSRVPSVTISKVSAKEPLGFVLIKDPLSGAKVSCVSGAFDSPFDGTAGIETINLPKFELKNAGNTLLTIFNDVAASDTKITNSQTGTAHGKPIPAKIKGKNENFYIWFTKFNGGGLGLERPQAFDWINKKMKTQNAHASSMAAQAMHYANTKNGGTSVMVDLDFANYNYWDLIGDILDGKFSN